MKNNLYKNCSCINNKKIKKRFNLKFFELILSTLFSISFSLLSYFLLSIEDKFLIILTLSISFVFMFLFVNKNIKIIINFITDKLLMSLFLFWLSIMFSFMLHNSRTFLPSINFLFLGKLFDIKYAFVFVPAIFYLFIYLYNIISLFIVEFWNDLDRTDKRLYLILTIVFSFVIIVFYSLSNMWYEQYDYVYSIDSGWVFNNIFPKIGYYDIRHPILGIVTFPIWAICKYLLGIFVPANLLIKMCAIVLQIINIQFLLFIAFCIKKITKNKWCFYLYLVSFPFLLFIVFFEKYQICTMFLVLYIYLYEKNKNSDFPLIFAIGTMPTSILIYLKDLLKIENIFLKLKKAFRILIKGIVLVICVGKIHLLNYSYVLEELTSVTDKFAFMDLTFKDCFISFINMIHSSFIGLSSFVLKKYEWVNVTSDLSTIGIVILIIIIIGVMLSYKESFYKFCILWLIGSFVLITAFQWSVHESPLFSIYFSWAFIPLFQKGLQFIIEKFKLNEKLIYCFIICSIFIVNLVNILDIYNFLS